MLVYLSLHFTCSVGSQSFIQSCNCLCRNVTFKIPIGRRMFMCDTCVNSGSERKNKNISPYISRFHSSTWRNYS